MYISEMGTHKSPRYAAGGKYYIGEEEGESGRCSDPSFWHIGIRCPFTLMIILIVG